VRKKLSLLALALFLAMPAAASPLRVGATPVPAAEILEFAAPLLKEREKVDLEVVEFTDFVTPNVALEDGDLHANMYQHLPYLANYNKGHGDNLRALESVYIVPMGIYSKKLKKLSALPKGALVALPSDPTNGGRALLLLESQGIIKLEKGAGLAATEMDIAENPLGLSFKAMEAAQLPRALADVDMAVINGNYALQAGLRPLEDSLLLEGGASPYAVHVVIRASDPVSPEVEALQRILRSDEVKKFITEKYKGGAIAAF
jgi:D-methionine transport system substrate-binding protein